ncbi:CCDC90 family protein [Desulfoferrobacter suflitae]|uniref:CCDC90 family protein n=1 Tax=Desulfoferrobacter suflitae TaxID=2865782 RepID=UPI002164CE02|nr:CCDC90 family protein [Desulfoferrobacter suflitae]MCK8603295.1 CCDC90 family protein [Desulfoferrobacter suflitae]MDD3472287.1 CCDC90 family protein [Syntrophaceae bacterium]
MSGLGFDTHAYVKKLRAVGFTEEQAEVQTQVIVELIDGHLATKRDLKELEVVLRRDLKELDAALRRDLKELDAALRKDLNEVEAALKRDIEELRRDMKEMELRLRHDLTLRLGGMLAAGIAVVALLVKLF